MRNNSISKYMSIALGILLLVQGIPSVSASANGFGNEIACFIAVKWTPIGESWSGNTLVLAPDYAFNEESPKTAWGRTGYPMPDAEICIDANGYNVKADDTTNTVPLYYCIFYLNMDYEYKTPTALTEKMFAVLDSAGQVWFDPDGFFNDCRHYGYANPDNPLYRQDPNIQETHDDIRLNANCYVDYISSNNTQGPYYILPTKANGDVQPGYIPEEPIYFRYDTEDYEGFTPTPLNREPPIKTRLFQLGWVDMPDFPLIQDSTPSVDYPVIPSIGTTLKPRAVDSGSITRWDIGLRLAEFIDDGNADFEVDEEWHTENINIDNRYTPAEWIYKRSDPILTAPNVSAGDIRLSDVVVAKADGSTRIYKSGTTVVDLPPIGTQDPGDDLDVGKTLIPFIYNGGMGSPSVGDEVHTENVDLNSIYDISEFIYRKGNNTALVSENDYALTDVNINAHRFNNTSADGVCSLGGCVEGDALLLVETIKSGPVAPTYNYIVESDLWMGNMPSSTKSSIFDPYGEPLKGSHSINKSSALGDNGTTFNLPVSVFFDVKADYRSFFGLSIWNDNGLDNCLGIGTNTTTQNNYSDYYAGRCSESFIGANYTLSSPDAERGLVNPFTFESIVPFDSKYMFADVGGVGYGCNERIYRKGSGTNALVEPGDTRHFSTKIIHGGSEIIYEAGSTVSAGDPDVGQSITALPADLCFFDIRHYDDVPNGQFDSDEIIYLDLNSNQRVDYGDIRMSDISVGHYDYMCGDVVDELGVYVHNYEVHGLTLGKCGDPTAIDIPALPGDLGITVITDRYLRVEQTSNIKVKTKAILGKDDKIHIVIRNMLSNGSVPFEMYNSIIYGEDSAEFEITPYRGSLNLDGTYDPIVITAYGEFGGIEGRPYPEDRAYQDRFFLTKYFYRQNIQNPMNLITYVPPPLPQPTVGYSLFGHYDAWQQLFREVSCERLDLASTRLCLDQLEERYPNINVECYNGDNVSDVNDPCCTPFALDRDEHTLVLFNANGAGVKWMGTAVGGDGQRYIIQFNSNRTYAFWYWNDIGPIPGALDAGDYVGDNPTFIPPTPTGSQTPIEVSSQTQLDDIDDSTARTRPTKNDDSFIRWGVVTKGDHLGVFDGTTVDPLTGSTFGEIETWGIWTYITSRGTFTETDVGGWAIGLIKPIEQGSVNLRITSFNIMLDYNSVRDVHPADYIFENHFAMDYTGMVDLKVPPLDTHLNFSEFQIIDRGLQFSKQNYTNGIYASNDLPPPFPQIQFPYNPVLRNIQDEFRVYPGGQTHAGRIFEAPPGSIRGLVHRWNSYPAIWSEWGQRYNKSKDAVGRDPERDKENHTVNFNKLGVEFASLTDYAIYFVLKDSNGNHFTFDPGTLSDPTPQKHQIKSIKVTGPFKTPKITDPIEGTVTTPFTVNGQVNMPLTYDHSGEMIIDNSNWQWYEFDGKDFTKEVGFGPDKIVFNDLESNGFLMWNHRLDYSGISNVIKIDEITPIAGGEINIEVIMMDGTMKLFQDCCDNTNPFGIKVHGLSITGLPDTIPVMQDHHFEVKITEEHPMQVEMACNNAFLIVWQDRGVAFNIQGMDEPLHIGQGDTNIEFPPFPSMGGQHGGGRGGMYPDFFDFNEDGVICFEDWETEVIGTYDLASNTWYGGMVDGRTRNYNDGTYHLDLTEDEGCQITDIGMDIGGFDIDFMKRFVIARDHVVSDLEYAPVYFNAYKYGDDNNDRAFSPYYQFESFEVGYTHEVYMAGQARANVSPADTLNVEISPQPLTAGVINELVDPSKPLTVTVTDSSGSPVNLLEGVVDLIGDRDVPPDKALQHCFRDWHPDQEEFYGKGARLPQYYWVRTDLHNEDTNYHSNIYLFSDWLDEPFQPISIDFTRSNEGIYEFYGFCTNDAGEFDLTVYSPDRKNMGTVKVKFELPLVEYSVINIDDPEQRVFSSPAEPDFLLTAGSNRIYNVTATCRNRQGSLISQPAQDVKICNNIVSYPAHFTPFINIPANRKPRKWFPCYECDINYDVHIGFDKNDDGLIQRANGELYTFGPLRTKREFFIWDQETLSTSILRRNSDVYYTTTNVYYSDSTFSNRALIMVDPDMDTTVSGWGLGCIYNQPYDGIYMFADKEPDGVINYDDFLSLDELGSCRFTIFAEDVCDVGGLVGCNPFTAGAYFGDVAGAPLPYYTDPGFIYSRYKYFTSGYILNGSENGSRDGTFFLDWDAMPSHSLALRAPKLELKSARTGKPLQSELFDPANFDLAYGVDNHLLVELHPADDRDLKMTPGSSIITSGANANQLSQGGFISWSDNDNPVTFLTLTPTGHGEEVIYAGYKCTNTLLGKQPYDLNISDSPRNYSIYPITSFDCSPAIGISLEKPYVIINGVENEISIRISDISTDAYIESAKVRIQGGNIDEVAESDANGLVSFKITPDKDIKLQITASADNYVSGSLMLRPGPQTSPPDLKLDPYSSITNKRTVTVSGSTTPGARLTFNDTEVGVSSDGSFATSIPLIDGVNTIRIISELEGVPSTSRTISVVVDSIPPHILLPKLPELIGEQMFTLKGRVEPGCKVSVNGQPATVVYDIYSIDIQLSPGNNKFVVDAVDVAGNITKKEIIIPVYKSIYGKFVVGQQVVVDETGLPIGQLPNQLTDVNNIPISILGLLFDAKYTVNNTLGICEVELFGNKYVFEDGETSALVSGSNVTLPHPAIIEDGMLYVHPMVIEQVFDCDVQSDTIIGEVAISRTWLP